MYIVDSLFVLLNISLSGSIIPSLLFFYEHAYNILVVAILNIVYLFVRFGFSIMLPKHTLFVIYFFLNFLNVFTSIMTSTGTFFPSLYLVANTTFYIILYNLYVKYKNCFSYKRTIKLISRGYVWISVLSIISTLSLFLFARLGFDLCVNDISRSMSIFRPNVELLGHTYYFPFSLGVFITQAHFLIDVPFFADYGGRICGLCFEPHILTFLVFPSLFFLLAYSSSLRRKIFLILVWGFVSLIALSVTNIVTFSMCIAVLLLLDKKWRYWGLIPLAIVAYFLIDSIWDSSFSFIAEKISGDDASSKDYSSKLHDFALSPRTLFGTNFFNNNYMHNSTAERTMDVGYIPFVFNLLFLIVAGYKLVVSLLRDPFRRMLSVGILYFFIHSTKIAMATYTQSTLIIIIFLLCIINEKEQVFYCLDEETGT